MQMNSTDTSSTLPARWNRARISIWQRLRSREHLTTQLFDTVERGRFEWGALTFVWGIWAYCAWDLIAFVKTFGVDIPHYDEWENIPALVGEQPLTLSWLWSQHNEHRLVIPRLIYLAVTKLAHNDFRAGMVFNIAALSLEAVAMIWVARRMRGVTTYSDAFFPLTLQTWGQADNLNCSFQVQFLCSSVLAIAYLALSAQSRVLSTRGAIGLGMCSIMLPLVGGNGLGLAPAITVAVILAGWQQWRSHDPNAHRNALVVWSMGLFAAGLTAFYFVDYTRPPGIPPSPSMRATFDAAVQFLSGGFGQAAKDFWPDSEWYAVAFIVVSFGLVGFAILRRPVERERAIRLGLVLGAMVSLAIGMGWARASFGPFALFVPRYVTLATPFLCAAYLAWELIGRAQLRKLVQMAFLLCAAVLAMSNHEIGKRTAEVNFRVRSAFYKDVAAGLSLKVLVSRYYGFTYYAGDKVLKHRMRLLHRHRVGAFRNLKN